MDSIVRSTTTAPVDDEPLGEEEKKSIRRSEVWFDKNGGRGIPIEEVLSELAFRSKTFLLSNLAVKINWSEEAQVDIRALDQSSAMFVFDGLLRYALTGNDYVNALAGEFEGQLLLRVGYFRPILRPIEISFVSLRSKAAVKGRKQAYR